MIKNNVYFVFLSCISPDEKAEFIYPILVKANSEKQAMLKIKIGLEEMKRDGFNVEFRKCILLPKEHAKIFLQYAERIE